KRHKTSLFWMRCGATNLTCQWNSILNTVVSAVNCSADGRILPIVVPLPDPAWPKRSAFGRLKERPLRAVFVDANETLAAVTERLVRADDPKVIINRDASVTSEQLPAVL